MTELDRIVLIAAHQFEAISNGDIQRYKKEHPIEIGDCLKRLVKKGYLKQYLSLQTLAELLGSKRDSIRNHYIKPMLSEGLLIPFLAP